MTQPAPTPTTASTGTVPAATAITTIPAAPKKTSGWASDFVARVLPQAPTPPTTTTPATTHVQAVGRAVADGVTVAVTSSLFGAAHAKGWLDAGGAAVDGVIGLLGLVIGAAAAPYAPKAARIAGNIGLTGVATVMFRKSFEAVSGTPMSAKRPEGVVEVPPGEDRIAKVAREIDL